MMQIRDARASDVSSMAELLLIVHQLHVNAHPETYREIAHETAVEFLAAKMADENIRLRVAEADSALQGYCSVETRRSPELPLLQARRFLYVNEIVVRPECRLGGVGRALIADLRELAQRAGIDQIELDVGRFNSGARAFFKRQGFEVLRARMAMRFGPE